MTLFAEMESKYEQKDTEYFVSLLDHPDYVVRTRVASTFMLSLTEAIQNQILKIKK